MNEQKKIKIGIVGAGHIAQVVHIPIWKTIADAEVVAVCDKIKAKARWVAEKLHIDRYYGDLDEMLKSDDIDAVDICTETASHKELAVAALSAGKHVLVEKPMARTYQEAKAMVDTARKYERHLMVAMNVRFRRDAITLKSFVDGNELGDIIYAKSGWVSRRNFSKITDRWLYNREISGGGVLMDLGIQMLDAASWLLGDLQPVSVKAVTFHRVPNLSVEDSAICMLQYESGTVLSLEVSWTIMTEKDLLYVNLYGTEGTALINPLRVYKSIRGKMVNITPSTDEGANIRYRRSYKNELRHFVACLNKNIPMQADAAEVAERLRILEALYRSAEAGKEITL